MIARSAGKMETLHFASQKPHLLEKMVKKNFLHQFKFLVDEAEESEIEMPYSLRTLDRLFRFLEYECCDFHDLFNFISCQFGYYKRKKDAFFSFCFSLATVLEDWHDKPEGEFSTAVVSQKKKFTQPFDVKRSKDVIDRAAAAVSEEIDEGPSS